MPYVFSNNEIRPIWKEIWFQVHIFRVNLQQTAKNVGKWKFILIYKSKGIQPLKNLWRNGSSQKKLKIINN